MPPTQNITTDSNVFVSEGGLVELELIYNTSDSEKVHGLLEDRSSFSPDEKKIVTGPSEVVSSSGQKTENGGDRKQRTSCVAPRGKRGRPSVMSSSAMGTSIMAEVAPSAPAPSTASFQKFQTEQFRIQQLCNAN